MSHVAPEEKTVNSLRLSVTDHCNTDCRYYSGDETEIASAVRMLSFEELLRIARAAIECGIANIRVTGGEPLVRRGLIPFLRTLSAIPGLQQLSLTTNGLLLEEMAEELRAAGVTDLVIRLDSLDEDTYATITGGADFAQALRGIAAAERAGLPLTLNMVVMKGVNDHEIVDFARLTIDGPVTVRFIEFSPAIKSADWHQNMIYGADMIDLIAERLPLETFQCGITGAEYFRIAGAKGILRIVTPVSGHACQGCSAIRVTASGTATRCVTAAETVDLHPWLETTDENVLAAAVRSLAAMPHGSHVLHIP